MKKKPMVVWVVMVRIGDDWCADSVAMDRALARLQAKSARSYANRKTKVVKFLECV